MKAPGFVRAVVSGAAILLLGLHLGFPAWRVDFVSVALLVVGALPWLHYVFKDIKISTSGIEVTYAQAEQALDRVVAGAARAGEAKPVTAGGEAAAAAEDPNLALVALRIEIERRLRHLAEKNDVQIGHKTLIALLDDLVSDDVIDDETAAGLRTLILAGNAAAHGARVNPEMGDLLSRKVPILLDALDRLIAR